MQKISGKMIANSARYAIVSTGWNALIVNALVDGAVSGLTSHGVDLSHITTVTCPGALEIPLTTQRLLSKQCFEAIVVVGAIIRGDTPHFDFVANESMKGLSQLMLQYSIPITVGILTVDTVEQALDRAGLKQGNKGREAALVAIEMIDLLNQLDTQLT